MFRDPRFKRIEVLPITGALGADIRGVDLGTHPDEATFDEVRAVLDHYHVVAIRDQNLTPQTLHEVARRFGPFSGNPVHAPIEGLDDIIRFVREPGDSGKVIGEDWHMDLAWMAKPPGLTMLYGEVIPPVGGDTCFTSLTHAWRTLSPGMQALVRNMVVVHSGRGVFEINAANSRLALRKDAGSIDKIEHEHPLVCVHPATGEPYLFVSSVMRNIKGLTEEESRPLLDYLVKHAIRPEFNCRIRWAPRTLTIWANPVVMHTAINDYPTYRRVAYRTTVEGWVPVPAPASAVAPLALAA